VRSLAGQRAGRKAISKQTYFILHKIKEVDEFFASAPPNCTRLSVRCIRSVLLRTGRAPDGLFEEKATRTEGAGSSP
jgi:hypothetical protein